MDLNSFGIAKSFDKKLIQIDGKTQSSYSSLYKISYIIWLIPQMDYVLNSPSDRSKFLDRIVSLFEENYTCCYMKYRKPKHERSKLLRQPLVCITIIFGFFVKKRNVPINLCSTGEQKLLLLSIILSSVKARCIHYNKVPLLLLDDIMSHLDKHNRKALIEEVLSIQCQTWITNVNQDNFNSYLYSFKFFKLLSK